MGGSNPCSGQTQSDEAGNFAFISLPDSCSGEQLVGYDGGNATTARDRNAGAPVKYAGVDLLYNIVTHQVTTPSNVIRLPRSSFFSGRGSGIAESGARHQWGLALELLRFATDDRIQGRGGGGGERASTRMLGLGFLRYGLVSGPREGEWDQAIE